MIERQNPHESNSERSQKSQTNSQGSRNMQENGYKIKRGNFRKQAKSELGQVAEKIEGKPEMVARDSKGSLQTNSEAPTPACRMW